MGNLSGWPRVQPDGEGWLDFRLDTREDEPTHWARAKPFRLQGGHLLLAGRDMYELQEMLAAVTGMAATSLTPMAGAQGELTALLMMRAYHLDRGDEQRDVILVPDSAHGTNPATTTMSGLRVFEIPSDARGNVDMAALKAACDEHGNRLVGMMLTNPNTLGLFDEHVEEIAALVHGYGGKTVKVALPR